MPVRLLGSITLVLALGGCRGVDAPGDPASMSAVPGTTPQAAVAGSTVATLPAVVVVDASGQPVPGVMVTFAVQAGGGTVAGASPATNSSGVAGVASWTLGATVGTNTLTATVANLVPVTFTATGTPGAAATITVTPPSVIVGIGGTQPLTSTVVDQNGNPITGAPLSYGSATGIATVSSTGLVTGVSWGATTITVTSGSASKNVPVIVAGYPIGNVHAVITGLPGRPFGLRISSAGKLAVTQQDLNTVTFLDIAGTGARAVVGVGADPGDVVFNSPGTIAFVSGFNDGSVQLVNIAGGTAGGSVTVGTNAYRLALSPDDTRLYVSSTNGTLSVVNPAVPSLVTSVALSGPLQGLSLNATGQVLYVTSTIGRVSRLSSSTLAGGVVNDVGGQPQDVAVTANGSEVVVANQSGWVDLLDGTNLVSKQRIVIPGSEPFGLAVSPDDAQVYVTLPLTGQVVVIDRATRAILRTITVGGTPRRVVFTADGLTALVANESGWVDVIK